MEGTVATKEARKQARGCINARSKKQIYLASCKNVCN